MSCVCKTIGGPAMGSNAGSGGGGGGLFVYDKSSDSYDLNTRILATAVICLGSVVVLMIFLHLYVRYVLLRRHRAGSFRRTLRFYVSNPHDDLAATVGLDASTIAALPAQPYRTSAKKDRGEECGGGAAAECAICLSAVEEAEIVRVLPDCNHLFHIGCVDVWLGSHSTCPVCRAAVVPPPAFVALDVGDSWAEEASETVAASQEAASSGFNSKDMGSASARLGSSFRRMLSWERATGRRAPGEGVEGLERQ